MDQNVLPINNTNIAIVKKQIEKNIAIGLITAVKDEKLEEEKLKKTAKEILNVLTKIDNQENLKLLLKAITIKWPFLSDISTTLKFENQTKNEKEVIDKLSSYIKGIK